MIVEFLAGFTVAGSVATAAFYVTRVKRTDLAELREKFELLRSETRDSFEKLRGETRDQLELVRTKTGLNLEGLREEFSSHRHATNTHLEQHDQTIDRNARAIENMFTGFNDKLNELKAEKSSLSMMLSNVRRPNG